MSGIAGKESDDRIRIRYTRKSTEDDVKQIASHEQQLSAMDAKWGATPSGQHFRDSYTGTTFDRPGFCEMERFCRENQFPDGQLGFIEVYDMSRFGRILRDGEEDPYAVIQKIKQFEAWGWEIRFATIEKTGSVMLDFIQQGFHAVMAAEYSKKLSRDVQRGRDHFLAHEGGARWLGGRPPFGSRRVDPTTSAELAPGERSSRGGSILVRDEQEAHWWEVGARMVLANATFEQVATFWTEKEARTAYATKWDHGSVPLSLTNPALIGEIHHRRRDPKMGQTRTTVYQAAWGPLVDPELFQAVSAEVAHRRERGRVGPRSGYAKGLLTPICARCGIPWYPTNNVVRRRGGTVKVRVYAHPAAAMKLSDEWRRRITAVGCKHWTVDAEILENSLQKLVLAERTTPPFVTDLRAKITACQAANGGHGAARQDLDAKLRDLQRTEERVLANMTAAQLRGLDDAMFWAQLERLKVERAETLQERERALAVERAASATWDTVEGLIERTRRLADAETPLPFAERRAALGDWIRQVAILVDHKPGCYRSSRKCVLATLRDAPTKAFEALLNGRSSTDGDNLIVGQDSTGTAGGR